MSTCAKCNGSGKILGWDCSQCAGTGVALDDQASYSPSQFATALHAILGYLIAFCLMWIAFSILVMV